MNDDEARSAISAASWYHGWEIRPGMWTPGRARVDPADHLNSIGVPTGLAGKTAIDIGTYDGPFAFEMERRGATVTAADIQDPDRTGFSTAHDVLDSTVRYIRSSVYDLSQHCGSFDVILFLGVYYHLKHPILAFEEIAKISHPDTILLIEGECLLNYAETLEGQPVAFRDPAPELPICLSYPGRYKGVPNWFIPNVTCIKGWLACGGFKLASHQVMDGAIQRFAGAAVRADLPIPYMADTDGTRLVEHPMV